MFWGNPCPALHQERTDRPPPGIDPRPSRFLRVGLVLLLAGSLLGRPDLARGESAAASSPATAAETTAEQGSGAPPAATRPAPKKRARGRASTRRRSHTTHPRKKHPVAHASAPAGLQAATVHPLAATVPLTATVPAAATPGPEPAPPGEPATEPAPAAPAAASPSPSLPATPASLADGPAEPAPAQPAAAPRRSGPLAPGVAPLPDAPASPPLPPLAPEEVWQHLPVTRDVLEPGPVYLAAGDGQRAAAPQGLFGLVPVGASHPGIPSPLRVDYTFDPELERNVFEILDRSHVRLGHVIVLDPETGRILAYASTDVDDFPPNRLYPAASLIKVVTAAAALHHSRAQAEAPCRFLGSPYSLTPQRIDPPRRGKQISLEEALATSNNQCFAQLAVHAVGTEAMVDAIRRFGILREPAPGHPAGMIDPGTGRFDLGRLGCGLWGTWITPLHAAELAATLARGWQVEPYWVDRVTDASGRRLRLAERRPPRQVLTPALAAELRSMLVETTVSGTARRGFHTARGASLLGPVQAAGKTGSLSGTDPAGRYEWFAGVAPADDPKVAIAVVVVNQQRYWAHASRVAGQVLQAIFCPDGRCTPEAAERWTRRTADDEAEMVSGGGSAPGSPADRPIVVSEQPRLHGGSSPAALRPLADR